MLGRIGRYAIVLALCAGIGKAIAADGLEKGYHNPSEVEAALKSVAKKGGARLIDLGQSASGRPLQILQIGPGSAPTPGILVVADMEGNCPPATEAALSLANHLADDWADEAAGRTWYILPLGNPDGAARFFASPREASFVNGRSTDADMDGVTDEDGPEDLNADGYITMMRQKHPEGTWMPVADQPVLMKEADAGKGEQGTYRLFTEGLDNDGDGEINEDGPGGSNPGHNFPHNFRHYTTTNGPWAGSEPESRALLEFAFAHPDIAMVLTFGRSNSLARVPEGNKSAESAGGRYKIPRRFAEGMGVSPDEEFPIGEIVEMARDFTGYQNLTEEMVLQFLGAGAASKPDGKDVPYWSEISKRYNDFLKEQKLDGERIDPPDFPPGSVDEWAYYQFGVPSFALDFWTVPVKKSEEKHEEGVLTPDDLEKMSNEEFIALGPEKIADFLKANDAPPQYTADMVIMGLKGGMMDTKKMAEFIRKGKKASEEGGADEVEKALWDLRPDAFVPWKAYSHPTLGEVEIGGMIPWSDLVPPAAQSDSLIELQLPFVRELVGYLPSIAVEKIDVERKAAGVWLVTAWVANQGFLPFPTYQGKRCERPTPATVELTGGGAKMLEGRARQVCDLLPGSGGSQKLTWLVSAKAGTEVTITAKSFSAGRAEQKLQLKEGGK